MEKDIPIILIATMSNLDISRAGDIRRYVVFTFRDNLAQRILVMDFFAYYVIFDVPSPDDIEIMGLLFEAQISP